MGFTWCFHISKRSIPTSLNFSSQKMCSCPLMISVALL